MSVDALAWALDKTGITPEQKLLLIYLADIVDMDDLCGFDIEHIKNFTGIKDEEKIMRCLREMRKKGIIYIDFVYDALRPIQLIGINHR